MSRKATVKPPKKSKTGKTVYMELSLYRCGESDPSTNLTISCPKGTQFRTNLSDNGLKKLKGKILEHYAANVGV